VGKSTAAAGRGTGVTEVISPTTNELAGTFNKEIVNDFEGKPDSEGSVSSALLSRVNPDGS
jgi:hypothetical protein